MRHAVSNLLQTLAQSGSRAGGSAQPMRSVVAGLTQNDMIDPAAYAASLQP
jgi:hypothetical protein